MEETNPVQPQEEIISQPASDLSSVVEEKKPKKKLLTIGLVILAIIALGVAGFFAYQNYQLKQQISQIPSPPDSSLKPTFTPDPTADWKTYANEKYGFELKYPTSWDIGDYENNLRTVCFHPKQVASEKTLHKVDIRCGLIEIYFYENVESIIGYSDMKFTILNNGVKARSTEEQPSSNQPNPSYMNMHIINYYIGKHIGISYIGDFEDTYLKEFNQVLSTFKFLDK